MQLIHLTYIFYYQPPTLLDQDYILLDQDYILLDHKKIHGMKRKCIYRNVH